MTAQQFASSDPDNSIRVRLSGVARNALTASWQPGEIALPEACTPKLTSIDSTIKNLNIGFFMTTVHRIPIDLENIFPRNSSWPQFALSLTDNLLNWANDHRDVSRSIRVDNIVNLIHPIYGSPKKISGMRCPCAETSFEVSWITPIVNLYVLVTRNILKLNPIGSVVCPYRSVIRSRWNRALVSAVTRVGILHCVARETT